MCVNTIRHLPLGRIGFDETDAERARQLGEWHIIGRVARLVLRGTTTRQEATYHAEFGLSQPTHKLAVDHEKREVTASITF
jgi:hypothetical protein